MNMRTRVMCVTFALCAFVIPTHTLAHTLNPELIAKLTGTPVATATAREEKIDPRGEERTFASFPEWYIVYSAQEYAAFVHGGGRPSEFPYFASIKQYWNTVDFVKAALGETEIDSNTSTVLRVIGISFTIENALTGAYEKTVGFVTEATNIFGKTFEDGYTEHVAAEYGQFLLHTPWYKFPYGQKITKLWSTYERSSIYPRGIERRIAFTIGYALKGTYGTVLGKLSESSLGTAQLTTLVTIEGLTEAQIKNIEGLEIVEASVNDIHALAPRYRAFTTIAESVATLGGTFTDIQGNNQIMLTVVAPESTTCIENTKKEFVMPILTQPEKERVAITSDVTELTHTIRSLNACGIAIEHIYDY